ncbi:alkaline phosphatase D family protein [Parvularcula oceani]|uniref:alkaline phosphatase D family protein n=1 Tax=Parvularcula oceani TaxID=1247963 RepID=UPI0005601006|nr:alkaline phosphatase D family protein [Parvularcula oceani]
MKRILLPSLLLAACSTGPRAVDAIAVPEKAAYAPPTVTLASAPLDRSAAISRIGFGSCAKQQADQSFWTAIAETDPDLFVFLGDNVYGDVTTDDPALPELRAAYYRLARSEPFSAFRDDIPVLPVWDDHDYGRNDAGADFALREESEALFEDVWALDADDPRRRRPGVYEAVTVGAPGERVQIILLDTRYFRSELTPTDRYGAPGKERYLPSAAPEQTMLGAKQEAWLAETLRQPADLRILVTSIQLLADGHGWEAWATMPGARERLYETLRASGAEHLVVVSGDRHAGAFYRRDDVLGYPLHEMTASSLNDPASAWADAAEEAGPHRTTPMIRDENFGEVLVDWDRRQVTLRLRDMDGGTYAERVLDLPALSGD